MRALALCTWVVVALAAATTAWAHHEPKHVKITILGFSAKQRIGARLPSDAVRPGRTYRHCRNARLYAFVKFKNMRENQPFEAIWTRNGRRMSKVTHRWPSASAEVFDQLLGAGSALSAGVYELFLRTSGKLRAQARVRLTC